ncbi:MAG: 4'-phosphopantetheinyl transferase superfamily protein [Kiritimatiellaceae bacterium]|nr:4'-phosphopantetheinyl transferase superfamily protein [Kiritimatiellaceae bacterium]
MKNKLESIQNAIEIWSIQLSDYVADLEFCRVLLSEAERTHAEKLIHPADAERSILCRGILRTVLADYLNIIPKLISFERNENGKPFLSNSEMEFNLSHSNDRMLIAVTAGRAVGVDIEFHRENVKMTAIAKRWFSPEEQSFFQNSNKPKETFFDIWSKKEAYVKAKGQGIYFDLPSFTVPLGEKPSVSTFEKNASWFFQTLKIDPDYSAAVVSEVPIVPIVQRTFGSMTI